MDVWLPFADRSAAPLFVTSPDKVTGVDGLDFTVLGDAASAEDVAQETFTRAWRHAAAYDPRRGPVSTWLLVIARNLAIDALRLRRAEPTDPTTLIDLQGPSTDPDPEGHA